MVHIIIEVLMCSASRHCSICIDVTHAEQAAHHRRSVRVEMFKVCMHAAAGTSMLIEDVACPVNKLADMTVDLVEMFQKFGYKDASCFGHALEGNLHLVFSQVRTLPCQRPSQTHVWLHHFQITKSKFRFSMLCWPDICHAVSVGCSTAVVVSFHVLLQ